METRRELNLMTAVPPLVSIHVCHPIYDIRDREIPETVYNSDKKLTKVSG